MLRFTPILGLAALTGLVTISPAVGAEVATDQRQVAIGYERLETLALRIADAVEATDQPRADQIRTAIGETRSAGIGDRFEGVIRLLERERYAAARDDQTELATQLEELLRMVMADPSESRLEEERLCLEKIRREIRSALREQRSLRARSERGENADAGPRQEELANRIERLVEPARETDRLNGSGEPTESPPGEAAPGEQAGDQAGGKPSQGDSQSIAERLEAGEKAMRQASEKLSDPLEDPTEEQRQAQRELEAAQREAEERLRQLREEEQQRRLATLAERFRRMHEAQVGLVADTSSRVEAKIEARDVANASAETDRATRIAAARLGERQAEVGAAARKALRLVRADASSLVFDDALTQMLDDIQAVESRLRETRLDGTTVALEETVVEALAEMIAAVDESLDDLEQKRSSGGKPGQGGAGGESRLVSRIAELRMIRSIQARLLKQTGVWGRAAESGEAASHEVAQRLERLAEEQRRLAQAARKAAKDGS